MIKLPSDDAQIKRIVRTLQDAGYETYIVGGAVRDLLLGRPPKDYDLSTAATPEEIRAVFGRRSARIIGKRFRLVHLRFGSEIYEIATFRRRPDSQGVIPAKLSGNTDLPDKLIFEDNDFGTAQEDAFRRDFTCNALFYDPIANEIIDFTGKGREDIQNRVVRIIGNPEERLEEDPVRLLRALKLVGQYGFTPEPETERALRSRMALIQHAANSRLTLELEKILAGCYLDSIFKAFVEYDLMRYFLPHFHENWNTPKVKEAMELISTRNRRVLAGRYRNSASVAVATLILPTVARAFGAKETGEMWVNPQEADDAVYDILRGMFSPHALIKRITAATVRMVLVQPEMYACKRTHRIGQSRIMPNARELLYIQNELWWHSSELISTWERQHSEPDDGEEQQVRRKRRRSRRKRQREGAVQE